MRLFLDFVDGPEKGRKLSLNQRTSFGRAKADIVLNDPKLSGTHAYFEFIENEGWIIVDAKSRNGVWVNGMKEVRFVLRDGDVIQLGSNQVICRLLGAGHIKVSEKLHGWFQSLIKGIQNKKNTRTEVKPEIRLRVIQGIQYGEVWDIFYGPRKAGRESLDICLYEDHAPKESFEIFVKGGYPYFKTSQKSIVKINDQSIESKQFEPGDIISIGDSQILVEFDEGHGFSS